MWLVGSWGRAVVLDLVVVGRASWLDVATWPTSCAHRGERRGGVRLERFSQTLSAFVRVRHLEKLHSTKTKAAESLRGRGDEGGAAAARRKFWRACSPAAAASGSSSTSMRAGR